MSIQLMAAQDAPWVVISGDWFVDENWFIAPHHSASSSHVGREHFRIVSEPTDTVKDLCGGGLVARVLYELRKYRFGSDNLSITSIRENNPNISDADASLMAKEFALCGTGSWHPADTDTLGHFVHANCKVNGKANKASFFINTHICNDTVDMELANLTNGFSLLLRWSDMLCSVTER